MRGVSPGRDPYRVKIRGSNKEKKEKGLQLRGHRNALFYIYGGLEIGWWMAHESPETSFRQAGQMPQADSIAVRLFWRTGILRRPSQTGNLILCCIIISRALSILQTLSNLPTVHSKWLLVRLQKGSLRSSYSDQFT